MTFLGSVLIFAIGIATIAFVVTIVWLLVNRS